MVAAPEPFYPGGMQPVRNGVRQWWRTTRRRLKACALSGPSRHRWQHPERVLAALEIRPGQRVADLGSGGGYFTFPLARAVGAEGRVYAVDTDPDLRELVAERAAQEGWPGVVPVPVDPQEPALPEPVDLILLVNVFHHLPHGPDYLGRLAGQLRPGGRVAVIEARPRWFLFGHATDPARITSAMQSAGLRLTAEHQFLPRQSFLLFAPTTASI